MAYFNTLSRRDGGSKATVDLLIVLLVLVVVSISCLGALWFLRRKRLARRANLLPVHVSNEKLSAPISKGHRRLSSISISTSSSLNSTRQSGAEFHDIEKQGLFANSASSPAARQLPQIRITFPDETDESGKRQSGRVVVLHVDDKGGVGLEPVHDDEDLPPYETGRFVSLDLERIGGLKEKNFSNVKSTTLN